MRITIAGVAGLQRAALLLLLSQLAACGGGGYGDTGASCSPAPQIMSTPPTQATVGQPYTYYVVAQHECGFLPFVCSDVYASLLPPGASASSASVSWTPSPSQANTRQQFSIATVPDYCGKSAAQSWTVLVLPDRTPPQVRVDPGNGATNIPVTSAIAAFFSKPVDPQTLTTASFLVSGPSGPIAGKLQVAMDTATFTPSANLPFSSTISVTITAVVADLSGNTLASAYSSTFSTGAAPDTSPPTVPAGLSATLVTASEVDFSWSSSVDDVAVAGYKVFRNSVLLQAIQNPAALNLASFGYSDTGLNFNTQYCYAVSAFDSSGNESALSSPLCVTTLDFLPGDVATWGIAFRANGTEFARTVPDLVSGISGVIAVSLGADQGLALRSDGTVWQLGVAPSQVANLSNAAALAQGWSHSVAAKSDGTVWALGDNSYGQLGDGTTNKATTPVQMSGVSQAAAVAAGLGHTLVLRSDGTVWATGANWSGQLGDGTVVSRSTAAPVASLSGVVAIAASWDQSLALKSDGTVWEWGNTQDGKLFGATQVPGLPKVVAIAQGTSFSLAVGADGTVWGWGRNASGELGDGTNTDRAAPVQAAGLAGVLAVAAGEGHSVALRADGTVWAWGYNADGELGDGTTASRNLPAQVLRVSGASAVAAGSRSSLALR